MTPPAEVTPRSVDALLDDYARLLVITGRDIAKINAFIGTYGAKNTLGEHIDFCYTNEAVNRNKK